MHPILLVIVANKESQDQGIFLKWDWRWPDENKVTYDSEQCPTHCLAMFKSRQQCIGVGAGEEEGFRNGPDKFILRVVVPKGFMFSQDIKRGWKQNVPRKIPDMLVYSNTVGIVRTLRIIAKVQQVLAYMTSFRYFGLFLSSLIHCCKTSNPSLHLPSILPSLSSVALVSSAQEARPEG